MKASTVIENCLKEKRMTQTKVAEHLSTNCANLSQRLRRDKDVKVSTFVEILAAMGYRVEIVDIEVCKITYDYMMKLIETKEEIGKFYCTDCRESNVGAIGIKNKTDGMMVCKFETVTDCLEWLMKDTNENSSHKLY